MISTICCNRIIALLFGITAMIMSGMVMADPPTRVARLGYSYGAVSYSPAGESDWVVAPVNLPLVAGDRLWADVGARDELQIGNAAIRMDANTSVTLLNMDDRVAQLQLSQGTLNVRVRRLGSDDIIEIDTPNLAFSVREPGNYRIDVDPDGNATTVTVRSGQGEADSEGAAYLVDARQSVRFAGAGLRDYQSQALAPAEEFDRWTAERDRRVDSSVSARYVSRDMIGYADLDDQGSWRYVSGYGNVWAPSHVAADWAPYHDGHWAWVDPWGWTWVDDAPWGFAVSHYGRWANIGGGWVWAPGQMTAQPVYAPALVAFVGGGGFQLSIAGGSVGGVAWFPLGPQDVYRPSYKVSANYFTNINASGTMVNHTTITNIYNNPNTTNVTYVNRQVPGAVVAVSATAFAHSQPVSKSAVKLTKDEIGKAPVAMGAAIAPVASSIRGAAAPGHIPPAAVLTRQVVVKTAPPSAPVPFASRQAAMAANPGRPLDAAALANLKPVPSAQRPQVKLVHPAQAAMPMSKAPASVPVPRTTPAAAAAVPQTKQEHAQERSQEHAVQPALPMPLQEHKKEVEAPLKEANAPAKVLSPAPKAKSAEFESMHAQTIKPVAAPQEHSMPVQEHKKEVEAPLKEANAPAKVLSPAPKARSTEFESMHAQTIKPVAAPQEHPMPVHEPVHEPAHEPINQAKELPKPPPAHAPVSPPAPKPEAAKHVDQHAVKGGEKKDKVEEEKQHKE